MNRSCAVALVPFTLLLGACAASKSPASASARSPEASAEAPAAGQAAPMPTAPGYSQQQGYPQQQPGQYPAQPAATTPTTPPSNYAPPPPKPADSPGRQAAFDFDEAERRLAVATSDCATACKALGSMDRSAGRICGLIATNDDQARCTDAKGKVVSARSRVKNTCGSCPDTSTDPKDPVPSR